MKITNKIKKQYKNMRTNTLYLNFFRDRAGAFSLLVILGYFIVAVSVWLGFIGQGWEEIVNPKGYSTANEFAPFGTNFNGQDIFQRAIYGTKSAFEIGLLVAFFSTFIGGILGLVGGSYEGSLADDIIICLYSCIDSLPFYLFILIVSACKSYPYVIHISMVLYFWTSSCKIVRTKVIQIKQHNYIEAAIALGASKSTILLRHITPNIYSILLVDFCLGFNKALKYETFLSFFGFKNDNSVSWGLMLAEASDEIPAGIYQNFIVVACFFTILLLAINIFTDSLQNIYKS